jgi:hypothetical protein
VTDHHSEHLLGFQLPTRMPPLKVGRKGITSGITFESGAFNGQFAVRADDTKYAYDVIHPRQMEYLMADPPEPFEIVDHWAWFQTSEHSPDAISHSSRFLRGFLARIPRFVWRNLGLQESPYPPLDQPVGR